MKQSKPEKKRISKTVKILIAVVCVVLALNIAVIIAVLDQQNPAQAGQTIQPSGDQVPGQQNTQPQQTTQTEDPTDSTQPAPKLLEMPYVLVEGKLIVESVFELDGINPDCGNAAAYGVMGIQLKNTSGEHLSFVELYVTAPNGIVVEFAAADIPSGMTVMLFSLDNISPEGGAAATKIECQAGFEPQTPLPADKVEISVEGTQITVKNISGEDLSQVTVHCHSVLADSYYGGITYQYVINSLPVGETATVTALDCILGLTDVVRIDIGT